MEDKLEGDSIYNRLTLILFGILILAVILTFNDYGLSWDEPVQHDYGILVLQFYGSFFHDWSAMGYLNLRFYGGLFDAFIALVNFVSPIGEYETRHLINALTGILGIAGCWKVANLLAGPRAAFFAALLLALTPTYYGHMFNNPKDIPFAVGYIWSIYYILRLIPALPSIPRELAIKLGIATGLTLAIRVGGILLIFYWGVPVVWHFLREWLKNRSVKGIAKIIAQTARPLLLSLAIAYALMLFMWPWALVNPISGPLEAISKFSHFDQKDMLYDGKMVSSLQLPYDYMANYLFIKLPEIFHILLPAGLAAGLLHLARKREWDTPQNRMYGMLVFSILFPIVYITAKKTPMYDGMRHFLFVVPPIAVIGGISLSVGLDFLKGKSRLLHVSCSVLLIAFLVYHLSVMYRLHPYQYIYFNQFSGGLPGSFAKYETDYYGNSYKEAVEELVKQLKAEDGEKFSSNSYVVMACSYPYLSTHFFPENFSFTMKKEEADFFLATPRLMCHKAADGKLMFTVNRLGVPLNYVKDLR